VSRPRFIAIASLRILTPSRFSGMMGRWPDGTPLGCGDEDRRKAARSSARGRRAPSPTWKTRRTTPAPPRSRQQHGRPGDGVCDAIECTLLEAIDAANGNPQGYDRVQHPGVVSHDPADGLRIGHHGPRYHRWLYPAGCQPQHQWPGSAQMPSSRWNWPAGNNPDIPWVENRWREPARLGD